MVEDHLAGGRGEEVVAAAAVAVQDSHQEVRLRHTRKAQTHLASVSAAATAWDSGRV